MSNARCSCALWAMGIGHLIPHRNELFTIFTSTERLTNWDVIEAVVRAAVNAFSSISHSFDLWHRWCQFFYSDWGFAISRHSREIRAMHFCHAFAFVVVVDFISFDVTSWVAIRQLIMSNVCNCRNRQVPNSERTETFDKWILLGRKTKRSPPCSGMLRSLARPSDRPTVFDVRIVSQQSWCLSTHFRI